MKRAISIIVGVAVGMTAICVAQILGVKSTPVLCIIGFSVSGGATFILAEFLSLLE